MDTDTRRLLSRLLRDTRVAALGTLRKGAPFVSMVAFVASPAGGEFLIHISRLAQHTRDLLEDPRASLLIAARDPGEGDPQTLPRVSIQGTAQPMGRDDPDHESSRDRYLRRFPAAELTFGLGDFSLFRITPHDARLVAGFGQTLNLTPARLREAMQADQDAA